MVKSLYAPLLGTGFRAGPVQIGSFPHIIILLCKCVQPALEMTDSNSPYHHDIFFYQYNNQIKFKFQKTSQDSMRVQVRSHDTQLRRFLNSGWYLKFAMYKKYILKQKL